MWQKVNVNPPTPIAVGQPGDLPAALRGLAVATLADLSPHAASVPALNGVGWWPVTEVDEDLDEPRLVVEEQRVEVARALAPRQAALRAAATAVYAQRIAQGCAYDGVVIPLHDTIQVQLIAKTVEALVALQELASWDTDFGWRTADDDRYALATPAAMLAFALAISAYLTALIIQHGALHDAIEAAEDHADLDAIDVTAGWPVTGYPGT
ncbi:MAG: hypothetical protein RIB84_00600 [Sneathiellaceae bacterium]